MLQYPAVDLDSNEILDLKAVNGIQPKKL